MPELGNVAAYLVYGFSFGLVWYHLMGASNRDWLRMIGYPLVGVILGEAVWSTYMVSGPAVMGLHPVVALFSSFIAVYLDMSREAGHLLKPSELPGFKSVHMPHSVHLPHGIDARGAVKKLPRPHRAKAPAGGSD